MRLFLCTSSILSYGYKALKVKCVCVCVTGGTGEGGGGDFPINAR